MLQIKQVDQHQGAERPLSVLRFLTAPENQIEEGETALSGLGTLCIASGFATGTCSLRAIGISNKTGAGGGFLSWNPPVHFPLYITRVPAPESAMQLLP